MGSVRYYDWTGIMEEDLLTVPNCTLTNNSATVAMTSTNVLLNDAYWVRFDPYVDADSDQREDDIDNMVNPGDYGYLIKAGSFVSGVSFDLVRSYRGPNGTLFNMRVRPAETPKFTTFGIPPSNETDAFILEYYARPRRLFNITDAPEWPSMGESIAYMATSVALEWHHHPEQAKIFWGRAMQRIQKLKRRKDSTATLVTDLTVGPAIGRYTGLRSVHNRWGR